jgi:hypothetical protein
MSKEQKYKKWEVVLFLFSLFFVFGALGVYCSGYYFSKSLFDFGENENPVGSLVKSSGKIQRESNDDIAFGTITSGAVINNYDTILTGKDGTGLIKLEDGGEIELTPNTMIRIAIENDLGREGLYRTYHVEVFNGKVQAKSNSKHFILKNKEKFITILKGENKTIESKKIVEKMVESVKKPIIVPVPSPTFVPSPLPKPKPSPIVSKLPVKVKVVVRPSPSPTPSPSPSPKAQPSPSPSPSPSFPFFKYVEVPDLKYPPDQSTFSEKNILASSEKRVLLTWVFKKYMEKFEVEISLDKDFKTVIARSMTFGNFYALKQPAKGVYWWRVRGFSQNSQSGFTDKRYFVIK